MKLGSTFLNSLRIKTQLFKMLQCVIVVNGAEGNGGWCTGLCAVPARRSFGSAVWFPLQYFISMR
jgi:hypothetical protein